MDFSDKKLTNKLIVMISFDARKVMKQTHQTMICMRIVNLRNLSWSLQAIIPLGVYEGPDSNKLLYEHTKQSMTFQHLFDLQNTEGKYCFSDNRTGQDLRVELFVTADGKGRKEGLGCGPYTSTYPRTWNHQHKQDGKNVDKYCPITRDATLLKKSAPKQPESGADEMSKDAKMSYARTHFGVCAPNPTLVGPERYVPDVLHFKLLTMNRLVAMTMQAISNEDPKQLLDFYAHMKQCLGVMYNFGFADQAGNLTCTMGGNDCERLRGQSDRIVTCDYHLLMKNKTQRDAIALCFKYWNALIDDDENRDVTKTLLHGDYFLLAHKAIKIGVALFGPKFPTPTMMERRDQIPYFKKMLLENYGLLLAEFDMQGVEHENKLQKRIFLAGLKTGGRVDEFEALAQLMVKCLCICVCTLCVFV
jgi:hypothetical protein